MAKEKFVDRWRFLSKIRSNPVLRGIDTLPLVFSLLMSVVIYLGCILIGNILSMIPWIRELTKI